MKLEKLGKHIKQIRGISYKPKQISTEEIEDYLPVIKANNITENGFDDNNLIYIHKKNIKDEQYIQKGDLVLAASSGSKKIIGKNIHFEENYKGSFGAFCKLVRPSKAINSKYLKHFFRTPYYRTTIEKLVQGANINNLKNQHLDNMIVPIPDNYDDQIRIATLLSRVEELIAKRKESIQLLDEFLKSTFLEMFGDPARNEKKWDIDKLKNCMLNTPQNGLYKPQSKYGTGVKIIRIDSFNNSVVDDIDSLKLVKVTEQEKNKYKVDEGDILINRVNSIDHLGKIGIIPKINEEIIYESNMMKFKLQKDKLNSIYLLFLFKLPFIKYQIRRKAKNAVNQSSINQQDVNSFVVTKPPILVQTKFFKIFKMTESIKTRYNQSLTELENLYGSLSQKAFKGELDLSKIFIAKKLVLQNRINLTDSVTVEVVRKSPHYTQKALKELIRSRLKKPFTFEHLMSMLADESFKSMPEYTELRTHVFKLLEGKKPILSQTFDMDKKQVVLSVNS